jgi:carnitine-CoA ligase
MHVPVLDPSTATLHGLLRAQAEAIPDAPYLLIDDARVSYAGVAARAHAWAAALRRLGVGRGDPIAFLMRTSPELVYATFGCLELGAIWIPTNPDYRGTWLRESLQDAGARVLVLDADLAERVAELGSGLPVEQLVVRGSAQALVDAGLRAPAFTTAEIEAEAAHAPVPDDPGTRGGDTACVLWTSGTTGRAKGVMQSHRAWLRGASSGARQSGIRPGDVLYGCLPMYNSAAWVAHVYRALVTGIPLGLDPAFSVQAFWERCRHYGATQILTLGTMHVYLWQAPEHPRDRDHRVRHASCIPMPEPLIEPFKKRFGLETLDQGYGQSEVLGMLQRPNDGQPKKPGSLGQPVAGVQMALLDDDDREVAPGEVGELCCRPTEPFALFSGYWRNPEATLAAFRNLWYHTGDLARRDADGDWFFVDRKADYIRHKGRNISSFEVERAFAAHPAVAEAAAIGVPVPDLPSEAELMVFVTLRPGARAVPEELARFVNRSAPYFFVPRYLELVDALPHTPTGRVQKYQLRERGVGAASWDAVRAGFVIER